MPFFCLVSLSGLPPGRPLDSWSWAALAGELTFAQAESH